MWYIFECIIFAFFKCKPSLNVTFILENPDPHSLQRCIEYKSHSETLPTTHACHTPPKRTLFITESLGKQKNQIHCHKHKTIPVPFSWKYRLREHCHNFRPYVASTKSPSRTSRKAYPAMQNGVKQNNVLCPNISTAHAHGTVKLSSL